MGILAKVAGVSSIAAGAFLNAAEPVEAHGKFYSSGDARNHCYYSHRSSNRNHSSQIACASDHSVQTRRGNGYYIPRNYRPRGYGSRGSIHIDRDGGVTIRVPGFSIDLK